MKVKELIERLEKIPEDRTVIIRDMNGLDWIFESKNLRLENTALIIDTTDINIPEK